MNITIENLLGYRYNSSSTGYINQNASFQRQFKLPIHQTVIPTIPISGTGPPSLMIEPAISSTDLQLLAQGRVLRPKSPVRLIRGPRIWTGEKIDIAKGSIEVPKSPTRSTPEAGSTEAPCRNLPSVKPAHISMGVKVDLRDADITEQLNRANNKTLSKAERNAATKQLREWLKDYAREAPGLDKASVLATRLRNSPLINLIRF